MKEQLVTHENGKAIGQHHAGFHKPCKIFFFPLRAKGKALNGFIQIKDQLKDCTGSSSGGGKLKCVTMDVCRVLKTLL